MPETFQSREKCFPLNNSSVLRESTRFLKGLIFLKIFGFMYGFDLSFHYLSISLFIYVKYIYIYISEIRSVVSDSLRPHESQHARPPCPSPTPGVHSDSHPSSEWCHPAISSSVIPFSFCPQSLPASESFPWVNSLHEVAKVREFQL